MTGGRCAAAPNVIWVGWLWHMKRRREVHREFCWRKQKERQDGRKRTELIWLRIETNGCLL